MGDVLADNLIELMRANCVVVVGYVLLINGVAAAASFVLLGGSIWSWMMLPWMVGTVLVLVTMLMQAKDGGQTA